MFYHRDIKAKHSSLSSLDLDCKCSAAAYNSTDRLREERQTPVPCYLIWVIVCV